MSDQVDLAFMAREPGRRPPPLTDEQVEQLVQYTEELAQVREDQAQELGLDPAAVFRESPQQLRGSAQFVRRLYAGESRRMHLDP